MGIFDFKKKSVVDLTEYHRKQQERASRIKEALVEAKEESTPATETGFGFFSAMANSARQNSTQNDMVDFSQNSDADEKRKRLAKRLADMTDKLEEISNQIYHLQQRIEVLEKKSGVNNY